MTEQDMGHGAISLNLIHRSVRKLWKKIKGQKLGKGMGIDWSIGYDVRNQIGPISIKNQGTNDGCSGYAGGYFIEIQRRLQNIKEGTISAKSIYAPIAHPGGGTTVIDLTKQIASQGANLELAVPSTYSTGAPLLETMMIEKSWETSDMTRDALTRAGYTPYDISEDLDVVAEVVQTYGAVLMEIQGKNNGTWLSANPVPPTVGTKDVWSHFMCIIGFKLVDGMKKIIALQSFGDIGDKGIQYFGEDYFKSGYIVDCFTLIYDANISPLPNNQSWWAILLRWFRAQWHI